MKRLLSLFILSISLSTLLLANETESSIEWCSYNLNLTEDKETQEPEWTVSVQLPTSNKCRVIKPSDTMLHGLRAETDEGTVYAIFLDRSRKFHPKQKAQFAHAIKYAGYFDRYITAPLTPVHTKGEFQLVTSTKYHTEGYDQGHSKHEDGMCAFFGTPKGTIILFINGSDELYNEVVKRMSSK